MLSRSPLRLYGIPLHPMSHAQEHSALEALPVRHPSVKLPIASAVLAPPRPPSIYRQRPRWRVEPASGGYLKPLDPSPLSPWKLQRGGAVSEQNNRSLPSSPARPQRESCTRTGTPRSISLAPYRDQRQYRKGPLTTAGSPGCTRTTRRTSTRFHPVATPTALS